MKCWKKIFFEVLCSDVSDSLFIFSRETWRKMVEKMFFHLEGKAINNYDCPVIECAGRNFCVNKYGEKKCLKLFEKNFYSEFVNLKFIEPFFHTESTSHNEAFHAMLWSKYITKNCSHSIRTRVTEARFASAVLNYNEGKAGYVEFVNSLPELANFRISSRTSYLLIRNAEKTTELSKKNQFKKKRTSFNRISNQVQNSDNVSVPAYKEDSQKNSKKSKI